LSIITYQFVVNLELTVVAVCCQSWTDSSGICSRQLWPKIFRHDLF